MIRSASVFLLLALAGCSVVTEGDRAPAPAPAPAPRAAPPTPTPHVDAMAPSEGPWGTLVTLRGEGLDGIASIRVGDVTVERDAIERAKTTASFTVPYPARGRVVVRLDARDFDAGTFAPTWETTEAIDVPRVLAARLDAATSEVDAIVADENGVSRVRFFGSAKPAPIPVGAGATSARLFEGGGMLATNAGELFTFADVDDALVDTGLAFGGDAELLTASATHAWVRAACKVSLVEKKGDAWKVTRGPTQLVGGCRGSFAEGDDGALHGVVVITKRSLLDEHGFAYALTLAPTAMAFESTFLESRNDFMTATQVLVAPGAAPVFVYCNDDTAPDEGTPSICRARRKNGDGFADVPGVPSELPLGTRYARAKDRIVAAKPHAKRMVLVDSATSSLETILSNDVDVEDLFLDAAGEPVALVRTKGNRIAAVRPRP